LRRLGFGLGLGLRLSIAVLGGLGAPTGQAECDTTGSEVGGRAGASHSSVDDLAGRGQDSLAASVLDVVNWRISQNLGGAEAARAVGLVGGGPVERALLITAPRADGIEDIVELVVLGDPAVRLIETAGEVVHAVRRAERKFAIVGEDEVGALMGVNKFVVHSDGTAGGGSLSRGVAGGEVVPRVIADVVRAL